METQRGVYPRFFAGANITSALDADGTGKAVIYNKGSAEEVIEGTAAGYADFAGVIANVDSEATVNRTNALVNQGARDILEGDAVNVENDSFVVVLISGTVGYGDFLTTADGGKFQKLTLSATPTATEVMQIVGRAMEAQTDEAGGKAVAHVWVRK